MFDINSYDRAHTSGPDNVSSVSVINFPFTSYIHWLKSISQTINFIDNRIQCFEDSYGERTCLYKNKY